MTNTRTQIEEAPYKLRGRGKTYDVELYDGTVIGSITAHRRVRGRRSQTAYAARGASGVILRWPVSSVDDAADLIHRGHAASAGSVQR